MDVVGGDGVIEDAQTESLAGRVQPPDPGLAIPRALQQELLAVAAVRDVPDLLRQMITIGSGPGPFSLEEPFSPRNRHFKGAGNAKLR